MIKRGARAVVSLALALVSVLTITVMPVRAAGGKNPFTDVNEKAYYFEPIMEMYNKGIMMGYGGGLFGPEDTVTHEQVLVMLTRVCGTDTSNLDNDTWYTAALQWAEIRLGLTDIPKNTPATRMDIAYYLVKAFRKESLLDVVVYDSKKPFTDTDSPVAEVLYYLGVSNGIPNGDGTVSFGGEQCLTRGQVATFFTRVLDIKYSKLPDITKAEYNSYFKKNNSSGHIDTTFYDSIVLPDVVTCEEDITTMFEYMMIHGLTDLALPTNVTNEAERAELASHCSRAYRVCCEELHEYAVLNDEVSYSVRSDSYANLSGYVSNTYMIKLHVSYNYENHFEIIEETEQMVFEIIEGLYADGSLTDAMNTKEKAKVLCEWVVLNNQYDTSFTNYDAYKILTEHKAVCSGYTALYTLLCRYVGIPIHVEVGTAYNGIQTAGHIWNYIDNCDMCGKKHYIDVTWCDPLPDRTNEVSWSWFWVDEKDWVNHTATGY